jgi:hypothetical protein
MGLPPGATLVSGQVPMALPPGATLVSSGASQAGGTASQVQSSPEPSIFGGGNAQDAAIMAQTQRQFPTATSPKTIGAVAGSLVLPGLAPEAGWLGHAVLTGLGGGFGTSAGQALSGENPASRQSLKESGANLVSFGLSDALFGGLGRAAASKFGRSFINESMGATGRDVIYGNPAKAITNEGVLSPFTGDIEKVKAAGGDLTAAGGRLGDVAGRIRQLQPQLNAALSSSTQTLRVADVIDKPLTDAMNDIIGNSAMTDAEKMAAISQLGGLQASLKQGLGDEITPLQANQLKNLIGSRVRWNGTNAVGDEVKPAYKAVYSALKDGVNDTVPEVADLNERLTNLHAAQDDLVRLARNEEVSRGAGVMRGKIGNSLLGVVESGAGRVLPGAAAGSNAAGMIARPALPSLGPGLMNSLFPGPGGNLSDLLR